MFSSAGMNSVCSCSIFALQKHFAKSGLNKGCGRTSINYLVVGEFYSHYLSVRCLQVLLTMCNAANNNGQVQMARSWLKCKTWHCNSRFCKCNTWKSFKSPFVRGSSWHNCKPTFTVFTYFTFTGFFNILNMMLIYYTSKMRKYCCIVSGMQSQKETPSTDGSFDHNLLIQ